MNTILDYLYWRKDLSFNERAFNEIDALLLAELSYVEWDGIVQNKAIALEEACISFFQKHNDEDLSKSYAYASKIPMLIKAMQHTRRYQFVKMKNYETVFDMDKEIQYAAITYVLDDGTLFVAYRGTDSTMIGWKEDMKMMYQDEVPSHQLAANYLKRVFEDVQPTSSFFGFRRKKLYPKLYVAGHSKGGNLAMYAAISAKEIQPHITKIYNFDGPGFKDSFYEHYDISTIVDKMITYLPQSSIIGRLLTHKENSIILKAYEQGLSQHDPFNWEVEIDGFVRCKSFSKESDETKKYIEEMLLTKSDEQKKAFIDMIFTLFDKLQINSVSDLSEIGLKQGFSGIKELSTMGSEDRRFIIEVMRFLWMQTKAILFVKK